MNFTPIKKKEPYPLKPYPLGVMTVGFNGLEQGMHDGQEKSKEDKKGTRGWEGSPQGCTGGTH